MKTPFHCLAACCFLGIALDAAAMAPVIVSQPTNTSVLPTASVEFNVVADDSGPFIFQWRVNGASIDGATNSSLELSNVVCSQDGEIYSVAITNAGGFTVSSNAVLSVLNLPPQLPAFSNVVVSYAAPFVSIPFQVSEPGLPAASVTMSATSSDTNLVPNEQILFSGADSNRLITINANSNILTNTTISVIGTGPCGANRQSSFDFSLTNYPPQISSIPSQHGPVNSSLGPISFIVSDFETPADQLNIAISSSSNNVVATNQIVLGGSGTNRTITILPGTNTAGTASITLKVTDALGASVTRTFAVTLEQFTQINPGLPTFAYSAVAWGDYDNDGRLD